MTNFDSQLTESTLFIDVGNSSIKVGFNRSNKWTIHSFDNSRKAALAVNNHLYPLKHIVLASVRQETTDALKKSIESHLIVELKVSDVAEEFLDYDTPTTLGIDRYLACVGAQSQSKKPTIVIDAGSACTIDYMDEKGVFKGGVIMPGLTSIMDIFKETAPELPKIDIQFPKRFPGKSTKESLELGQVVFYSDGIKTTLERYEAMFGESDLYISGGDADIIKQLIGNIGTIRKELVFDGMAKIFSEMKA